MRYSPRTARARPAADDRRGFTLLELMLAMSIGLVVLASATGFAISTWRTMAATQLREGVTRNGRFIGMSLERDLQETGVALESNLDFGSLAVRNDTLTVLSVPFDPDEAPDYYLSPPAGTTVYLPPGGTCGPACVHMRTSPRDSAVKLVSQDLALMIVDGTRRLILVDRLVPSDDSTEVHFHELDSLLHRPASLTGITAIKRASTALTMKKLRMVAFWREDGRLMRAERLRADGSFDGAPIAEGVESFDVTLIFTDGDEAGAADPDDSDDTNDYNDIVGIRVRAVLRSDRVDVRVNGGLPFERRFEWRVSPRNLAYERNRNR